MTLIQFEDDGFAQQAIVNYQQLFAELEQPSADSVNGDYLAEFIGPVWLRKAAALSLPIIGLPGWVGKRFKSDGTAINLLLSHGQVIEKVPMDRNESDSNIVPGKVLALSYPDASPLLLRPLIDEFRALDGDTLLGLTLVNLPLLRGLPLPFLLRRKP